MGLINPYDKTSCPRCAKQVVYDYLYVCPVPPGCGRHACHSCWKQAEACPSCGAKVLGRCYVDEYPNQFRSS